jgi:phage terminase large subunit
MTDNQIKTLRTQVSRWKQKIRDMVSLGRITEEDGDRLLSSISINNITKIKSIGDIKYCYVEEEENISQRSWDVLLPTIRIEGSEMFIVFNPYIETDPTYVDFVKNQKPNSIVRKINYHNNPFLSEKSKRAIAYLKQHDYKKYLHVYEGEFYDLSDLLVFTKWQIGEVKHPTDGIYYYAMDFGYSDTDPTALIRLCIHEELKELHIFDEVYEYKVDIDDLHKLIELIPLANENYIIADSARPETIAYLKKKGYYILSSIKGPGSILEGIEIMQGYTIVVHPKCKNMQYELSHYAYLEDKKTGLKIPNMFTDKNNHLIDACRYALERYRRTYVNEHFDIQLIG